MKSTNYYNTFIEVAEDCPKDFGEVPPKKGTKISIANLQYDLISANPYKFTSDEILFNVFSIRNKIDRRELKTEKEKFFSKGQPCFRSSPLAKRYGWGIHSNVDGKIALVAIGADEYEEILNNDRIKKFKAMRSKRK